MNLLDDADMELLGLAAFQMEYKEEGEADYRGWNHCLNSIWKIYNEMNAARDRND